MQHDHCRSHHAPVNCFRLYAKGAQPALQLGLCGESVHQPSWLRGMT